MVRIPRFHCQGPGSIPGWGTNIPKPTPHHQKQKKNCYYTLIIFKTQLSLNHFLKMLSKGKWEIASVDWKACDVPTTLLILRDNITWI